MKNILKAQLNMVDNMIEQIGNFSRQEKIII